MSIPPAKLSVVFTTYNSPAWLEKVFWGLRNQSFTNFEVIVADDGSTAETAELIERERQKSSFEVRHVWQADKGFRKCRILNKALLHATTDYVVLTDGDCILRGDFLAVHAAQARPNTYLSGSYNKLPLETSQAIDEQDVAFGLCFQVRWLRQNGMRFDRKALKLRASRRVAPILNRLTVTRCNLKGSNASVWLSDALAVNGFDEGMQWGGLDRDFGVRLRNHGLRPRHVRYDAICVHLDHARGYRDPQAVADNRRLREQRERSGESWTERGIAQILEGGYEPECDYALTKLPERARLAAT